MTPRKLNVAFIGFPYGGNGAAASTHPDVEHWFCKAIIAAKSDPRIGEVLRRDYNDTPATMVRNAAVKFCQDAGVDVMVMVDSDQAPDLYLGVHANAKPFFQSSFDKIYEHWEKGPLAIVGPYCGPPAHPVHGGGEVVFIFRWANQNSGEPTPGFRQERFTREEAETRTGFEEISAGPTGLCMIDMRCFDLLTDPKFYYEWEGDGPCCPNCHQPTPGPRAEKSSTEDCVFFRDVALNGIQHLGYNPCLVNWDAWAGHWKPKCVGKPESIKSDQVSETLRKAVLANERSGMKRMMVKRGNLPVHEKDVGGVKLCVNPERHIGLNGNGKGAYIDAIQPKKSGVAASDVFEVSINGPAAVRSHPLIPNPVNRIGEKGVTENGQHYEIVHPDDTRLADRPVDMEDGKPAAFREIHNMNPEDLEIILAAVRQRAIEGDLEGRAIRMVELGTWTGKTAVLMAQAAHEFAEYELHCIDHFQGGNTLQKRVAEEHDVYEEFLLNTAAYRKTIIAHRDSTHNAAVAWAQRDPAIRDIDLLFIDADHSYKGCLQDILDWWPFVRYGCTVIGHDFNCQFSGVIRAAVECFGWNVAWDQHCWIAKKGVDKLLIPATDWSNTPGVKGLHETLVEFGAQPA